MCGIFGYIGPKKHAVSVSLEGLKKLEYRGYDSAGIAGIGDQGDLLVRKQAGKISNLEQLLEKDPISVRMAISHTRWATHGKICVENAHPQLDFKEQLAITHNGIIENHNELRRSLQEKGVPFTSETDTEVIAQLIGNLYTGDLLKAVQRALVLLKGALSIAVVHKDHPDAIFVACKQSPLAIGIGNGESFISSDTNAFMVHTQEVVYLTDGEVAVVKADSLQVFDETMGQVIRKAEKLTREAEEVSKGNFEHYMLKEIYEQPQTIRNALLSRFLEEYGTVSLDEIKMSANELLHIERIIILACGSSWHAGCAAAYMLEEKGRIPCQVEISSEFRYKNPIVPENSLVIAISQSGETADTLAAMRELKAKGAKILAICNTQGSTIDREADSTIYLKAGLEIGVASTKAFTSQLVVLSLISLYLARMRHMSKKEGQLFLQALKELPDQVQQILDQSDEIKKIAKEYAQYDNFFYLGRHYMFPIALEGALKLKEISYINANAYPAGEMKHGPIALINEACPTVALCTNSLTFEKMLSNVIEVKTRKGAVFAIVKDGDQEAVANVVDHFFVIPKTRDALSGILANVVLQLFAYHIAYVRGAEIDQPRNLAKSVTVE